MDTPTALQFRLSEASEILSDLKDIYARLNKHRDYLADPTFAEAHRSDCEANDEVIKEITLASGDLSAAIECMSRVIELTPKPETENKPMKPIDSERQSAPTGAQEPEVKQEADRPLGSTACCASSFRVIAEQDSKEFVAFPPPGMDRFTFTRNGARRFANILTAWADGKFESTIKGKGQSNNQPFADGINGGGVDRHGDSSISSEPKAITPEGL